MASLSIGVPFLNHDFLSVMGSPSGGEMLSNETVETEDGSFEPLASTVAIVPAVKLKRLERRRKQLHRISSHRELFVLGRLYIDATIKPALVSECGDRTQRAKKRHRERGRPGLGMMRTTQAITTRGLDSIESRM